MSEEYQVNVKSQSELDIGGHETCYLLSLFLNHLFKSSSSATAQLLSATAQAYALCIYINIFIIYVNASTVRRVLASDRHGEEVNRFLTS